MDIEQAMRRVYDAFGRADPEAYERMLSHDKDSLHIGTDQKEWWDGFEVVSRAVRAQLGEIKAAGVSLVPGEQRVHAEGSVAWVVDRPSFRLPDGTEEPLRFTAVFHREDGEWKMIHSHISLGVPNETAIGRELTT
jgi:ketosteroid isomerase-like protein